MGGGYSTAMKRLITSAGAARSWHLVTGGLALVALVTQVVLVSRGVNVLVTNGTQPSIPNRLLRFFSYFTIQSNIIVAATSALLVARPARDGRTFRVLRIASLYGIGVTGIIYAAILAPVVNLTGLAAATDATFHYIVPILAVGGWLLFGPRPRIDVRTLLWSLIWPAVYIVYTVGHGAIDNWYPYPFTDVNANGYARVLVNGLGVIVLLLAVGGVFLAGDRRLGRAEPTR